MRADTQTQLKLIGVAGLIAATGWVSPPTEPPSLASQYQLPLSVVTPRAAAVDETAAELAGAADVQTTPHTSVRLGPVVPRSPVPPPPLLVAPKQGPPLV